MENIVLIARLAAWTCITLTLASAGVCAQDFPRKPIRILTSEAGASSDFTARLVATGLSPNIGQPVIVENHPGNIVAVTATKAAADGYTLLYAGTGFMFGPLLQNVPYDAVRDFSPITIIGTLPAVFVVHQSVPAKTIRELIDLAKAKPGVLNYASAGGGSASQLSMELFKNLAGVNIERIPYKGGAAMLSGIIGGEAQMMIIQPGTAAPYVKSGALKALAVTTAQPSALAPGLPTVAASGLPGYDWTTIDGMWTPKGTPAAITRRLNQEIVRVINRPDVKEKFFSVGLEVVGSSPDALADKMKKDIGRISRLIKDAGIRAE
jgi:tripartite-type tricarboxylate transporter receptor subunit TctC